MRWFGIICAVIAFALCMAAGLWILTRTGLTFDANGNDDILSEAIGIYFIGKAFFVGPMLVVASVTSTRPRTSQST